MTFVLKGLTMKHFTTVQSNTNDFYKNVFELCMEL